MSFRSGLRRRARKPTKAEEERRRLLALEEMLLEKKAKEFGFNPAILSPLFNPYEEGVGDFMATTPFCHIGSTLEGKLSVRTSFSQPFIDAIKRDIPWTARSWDKDEKAWIVSFDYLDLLLGICDAHFSKVELLFELGDSAENDPYSALFLLKEAPIEVVNCAYKTLALLYHPDKGGDHEKMTSINVAYQAIKKERGL